MGDMPSGAITTTEERQKSWEQFRGEDPMQMALEKLGLTPDKAAECLARELEATEVKAQVVDEQDVVDVNGSPTVITTKVWSYSKPLVLWGVRQRARQDIMKAWGSIPKGQQDDEDKSPLVLEIKQYSPEPTEPSTTRGAGK